MMQYNVFFGLFMGALLVIWIGAMFICIEHDVPHRVRFGWLLCLVGAVIGSPVIVYLVQALIQCWREAWRYV